MKFDGTFNDDGSFDYGTLTYRDGTTYQGRFNNGFESGSNRVIDPINCPTNEVKAPLEIISGSAKQLEIISGSAKQLEPSSRSTSSNIQSSECTITWKDGTKFCGYISNFFQPCLIVRCHGELSFSNNFSDKIRTSDKDSTDKTNRSNNYRINIKDTGDNFNVRNNVCTLDLSLYLNNILLKDVVVIVSEYNCNNTEVLLKFCNYGISIVNLATSELNKNCQVKV